jgi:hypothetical protein
MQPLASRYARHRSCSTLARPRRCESPGKTSIVVGSVGVGIGGALLAVGIPVAAVYGREGVASTSKCTSASSWANVVLASGKPCTAFPSSRSRMRAACSCVSLPRRENIGRR